MSRALDDVRMPREVFNAIKKGDRLWTCARHSGRVIRARSVLADASGVTIVLRAERNFKDRRDIALLYTDVCTTVAVVERNGVPLWTRPGAHTEL